MAVCLWLAAHGTSCLEAVAVVFGIVSVYLSTRENIWSWPTALINVSLFTALFLESGLYSDTGLQVVYFVLSVYGWYEWLYGGAGQLHNRLLHHTKNVDRARDRRIAWLILALSARAAGNEAPLRRCRNDHDQSDGAVDDDPQVAPELAAVDRVDVVYVGMFVYKGLYLTAFNYAIYLRSRCWATSHGNNRSQRKRHSRSSHRIGVDRQERARAGPRRAFPGGACSGISCVSMRCARGLCSVRGHG